MLIFGSLAAFSLGGLRMEMAKGGGHPLDASIGKNISLSGIICDEPAIRESSQGLCLESEDRARTGNDKILLNAGKFPLYAYGDTVQVFGRLDMPRNFLTYEGGPEFDYVSYLAKDGIRYSMSRPKIRKTASGKGFWLISALINIKSAFMDRIGRLIPEPQASLVGGLLLGEKGALPKDVVDDFKRSGLTHILVLSGSNVTVVAESLLKIFAIFPRAVGQSLGASSIVLFAIMTGASATTVRATLMALIGLLAQATARKYDVVRALIIAASVMLMQNPRILVFDISFQLSFLATIAVIFVSPVVKERLTFIPEKFGMREIMSMTISTQLFTLPFIFYKMGEISIIALVPNLLVLPIVSLAMLGGFIAGTLGFVWMPLALPAALATKLMLSYMLTITHFFSSFPLATIQASISVPLLVLSYFFLVLGLIFLRRKENNSRPSTNSGWQKSLLRTASCLMADSQRQMSAPKGRGTR